MQIAVAQLNTHLGNLEKNEQDIIAHIKKASSEETDIIIFPELSLPGFSPEDLLFSNSFLEAIKDSLKNIAKYCVNIATVIGAPYKLDGKLYNAAYFLANGKIDSVHSKTCLSNQDIFNEGRYFQKAKEAIPIKYKGKRIILSIGNELWAENGNPTPAISSLLKEKADLLINLSTSPFSTSQIEKRNQRYSNIATNYNCTLCFVNQVGAHADIIFDGTSSVYNSKGKLCLQLPYFKEDIDSFNLKELKEIEQPTINKYKLIEEAIVLGIKDYFHKHNFKRATLGLSGGIDSALGLVLAVKALGKENVTPLLIPSQFSSEHSVSDAVELCKNLGCNYNIIPMAPIYDAFIQQTKELFKGKEFDTTEENIQSRIRGVLLMAQSNKFGDILLNTSNKSEIAVGYVTLYGDMAGGLSIIGDLYKSEVYELSRYINREQEIIPIHIIEKPPSAELRPDQKDSDSLPSYDILDKVLYDYIELQKSAKEIIQEIKEEAIVNRIIKLVNQSEHKRKQSMPILRVSSKGFGRGRRMPLAAHFS